MGPGTQDPGIWSQESGWAGRQGLRNACAHLALELLEVDLDGQLPSVRPLPHVAVLKDELLRLFQDDYVASEEEAEARGQHMLEEKFGERHLSSGSLFLGRWPSCM